MGRINTGNSAGRNNSAIGGKRRIRKPSQGSGLVLASVPFPPLSVDDDFTGANGDPLDDTLWIQTSSPQAFINNNKARFDNSTGDLTRRATSTFSVGGDFSIQIDLDYISASPLADQECYLHVHGIDAATHYARLSALEGSFIRSTIVVDGVSNSDNDEESGLFSGKLKVERVGSTWNTYFWKIDQWVLVGTVAGGFTGLVWVRFQLSTWATSQVVADWDNFIVVSDSLGWL
jgi:hypothetical protein